MVQFTITKKHKLSTTNIGNNGLGIPLLNGIWYGLLLIVNNGSVVECFEATVEIYYFLSYLGLQSCVLFIFGADWLSLLQNQEQVLVELERQLVFKL